MDTGGTSQHRFVFLSATAYDSLVSGRTRRLAEALAAAGREVDFVELPTVRDVVPPLRGFGPRPAAGGTVRVIRLRPLPGSVRLAGTGIERGWAGYAARRLAALIPAMDRSVLVTSTPRWAPVVARLAPAVRCYDYIDHVQVQAGPKRIAVFEVWDKDLLDMSDMVTTVSEPLRRYLIQRVAADRVFMVPNGVLGEWVDTAVEPVPRTSLARRPDRPIAGFLGSLYEWIDLGLLVGVARALPQVEFALVGPSRRGVRLDALRAEPNVRCLPAVTFEEVPGVIKALDVAMIPFRRDVIAEYADPLKLYEYAALRKPVVSTVGFSVDGRPAPVAAADNVADFAAAIERALIEDSPERQAERAAFARENTWARRARDFLAAADETLRSLSSRPSIG